MPVMQDKRAKMRKETMGQLIRALASMAGMGIEAALETMAAWWHLIEVARVPSQSR